VYSRAIDAAMDGLATALEEATTLEVSRASA
jgi:hypothetical protein